MTSPETQPEQPFWQGPVDFAQSVSTTSYRGVQSSFGKIVDSLRNSSLPLFGERPTPRQAADKALQDLAKQPTSAVRLRRALQAVDLDWRSRVLEPWGRGLGAAGQMLQPQVSLFRYTTE